MAKGLGAKPTAILMARKMGEPIEHWDQLLLPQWGEPLPVIVRKDGERTLTDWSPKRKTVGSGEKSYVVKQVVEEPKAAVPRRNLPRYIVKAKRGDEGGGKVYQDARRFKDDMLKELRRQIGTPVQKVDQKDLYESVFVGFIVHLTGECTQACMLLCACVVCCAVPHHCLGSCTSSLPGLSGLLQRRFANGCG